MLRFGIFTLLGRANQCFWQIFKIPKFWVRLFDFSKSEPALIGKNLYEIIESTIFSHRRLVRNLRSPLQHYWKPIFKIDQNWLKTTKKPKRFVMTFVHFWWQECQCYCYISIILAFYSYLWRHWPLNALNHEKMRSTNWHKLTISWTGW